MKNVYSLEELEKCYPEEVILCISESVKNLDENYGEERDVENDLGGYVIIAENIVDIEILKQDKLQDLIPEYTDIIECRGGVNWTSSLFMYRKV